MSTVRPDTTLPVKVTALDLECLPAMITHDREAGVPYRELWCLIREDGRPLGLVQLPFQGKGLTRGMIETASSALRRHSPAAPGDRAPLPRLPSASVVIPSAMRRTGGLASTLDSVLHLDYLDYEVIVVDNRRESDDELPPFLANEGRVRVVRERRPGISAARNAGVAAASGEFVAFTDDDVVVDRGWLRALGARIASHPHEVGVTGFILPGDLETEAQLLMERHAGSLWPRLFEPVTRRLLESPAGRWTRRSLVGEYSEDGALRRTFSLYAAGAFGAGANMSFRIAALRDAGPFDLALGAGTRTAGGEDLEMMARLVWGGASLGYEPAALVQHTHRAEGEALLRQFSGWGTGFSAMLLALVLDDPAHLRTIARTLPHAAAERSRARVRRGADSLTASVEEGEGRRQLARRELAGLLRGPLAYLASRREVAAWPG